MFAVSPHLFAQDCLNWSDHTKSPSIRHGYGLVYDSGRGVNVLFGGHNGSTSFLDASFNQSNPSATLCAADFNGDGTVNAQDLDGFVLTLLGP